MALLTTKLNDVLRSRHHPAQYQAGGDLTNKISPSFCLEIKAGASQR
jgi:hypothetical protein